MPQKNCLIVIAYASHTATAAITSTYGTPIINVGMMKEVIILNLKRVKN